WQSNPVEKCWFDKNPLHNRGLLLGEPGGRIVDVDLDHELALRLAQAFLPPTGMTFGRESKPQSHWIYRVDDRPGETKRFQHGNHGTLVEFRSDGAQTVFPPSIHESGEQIRFDTHDDPMAVASKDLRKAVGKLAAATLLGLNWSEGRRHDLSLALAGWLLNAGWNSEEVGGFISAVCRAVGDLEPADRISAIDTTQDRLGRGESCIGWPRFAELVGIETARKIAEWLDIAPNEHIKAPSLVPSIEDLKSSPVSETDLGNAKRFVLRNGEKCFFNPEKGCWYVWDGCFWKRASAGEIDRLAHETAESIFAEAGTDTGLAQWGNVSCGRSHLAAMPQLAAPYLAKGSSSLNQDPFLFNCQNGTLDLKSGKLLPHNRCDWITQIANLRYSPEADCPRFKQFIEEICQGDKDLALYVQSAFGYALTGNTDEDKFFILYGNGANGKSTLIDTIKDLLGDYAKTAQADTLMQKSNTSGAEASPDLARLDGSRSVFFSEGNRGSKFDEGLVKQLTGGDAITARELYGKPFEFKPSFKLFFVTNYLPKITGNDNGIWRRLAPIPFGASFEGTKGDKGLSEKLQSEKSGILNWLLEGCRNWQEHGLIAPKVVSDAVAKYRTDSDNVARFLGDCTVTGMGHSVSKSGLYSAYKQWVMDEGEHYTASNKEFSEIVVRKTGAGEYRTASERRWLGIRLN
ncbi:MAG: bifunctional DNA primase/polymerase, partial [Anaerolineales bacterium]|nr:bifunctional DNA primase/polymerase [Anaerolineales bacterium]